MSDLIPAGNSAADWSQAIVAIATRKDREAFARLFAYFAPRIKTFMRRSGTSDGEAEEFAQEALLMRLALHDGCASGICIGRGAAA